jgi:hypothetical protein
MVSLTLMQKIRPTATIENLSKYVWENNQITWKIYTVEQSQMYTLYLFVTHGKL